MSVSIFKNEWNKIDFIHLGPMSSVTYKHLNIFYSSDIFQFATIRSDATYISFFSYVTYLYNVNIFTK